MNLFEPAGHVRRLETFCRLLLAMTLTRRVISHFGSTVNERGRQGHASVGSHCRCRLRSGRRRKAARHDEAGDSPDGLSRPPHSHSIINSFRNPLIGLKNGPNRAGFTVRYTATWSGIPECAAFIIDRHLSRTVSASTMASFRDLSRSIESWNTGERSVEPRRDSRVTTRLDRAPTTLSACRTSLFRQIFYRQPGRGHPASG